MSHDAVDHQITDALLATRGGAGLDQLMPVVYEELRRIAHRQLNLEATGHTLSTTGLVHEAYLKLVDQTRVEWNDRAQFFAVAAQAMRRILVDYARRHRAARRGGAERREVPIEVLEADASDARADHGAIHSVADQANSIVALDEALERLAALSPRLARVVEYRFFGGYTEKETAELLGVSQRTAAREWMTARAWLYQQLQES